MDCSAPLKALSALDQLEARSETIKLLPFLLEKGLSDGDAIALSYNTALLYFALELAEPVSSPKELLSRLSLGEIASLCERYADMDSGVEYGVNKSFGEVTP